MKRILVYLFLLLCTVGAKAQQEDVVKMKSGNEIRGTITEWIQNESLTIVNADGVKSVCPLDKVETITRSGEAKMVSKEPNKWRIRGYRGFVDMGYSADFRECEQLITFATTHGYQFNPILFVGGGLELFKAINGGGVTPIYADVRCYFSKTRISPFFEGRLGMTLGDRICQYTKLSLGLHCSIKPKLGINVAVGWTPFTSRYIEANCIGGTIGLEF